MYEVLDCNATIMFLLFIEVTEFDKNCKGL